jgi:flagellar biosynthesis GTPase FlhF
VEPKRFIGNDMQRIYDRVRREFGAEAEIVRTRSLYREGAEPLIEVLAAAPNAGQELALDLQWTMVDGALGRLQIARARATVGDLEDMVARDTDGPPALPPPPRSHHEAEGAPAPAFASTTQAPAAMPEWFQGFVPAQGVRHNRGAAEDAAVLPAEAFEDEPAGLPRALDDVREAGRARTETARVFPEFPAEPLPAMEWGNRPRAITETIEVHSPAPAPAPTPTPVKGRRRASARAPRGLAAALEEAGLTARAATLVTDGTAGENVPERALAEILAGRWVRYPDENNVAIVTVQGPVGAGRTTALIRMALDCSDSGREAVLVAADFSRAAGRAQVHAYADAIGVPVEEAFDPADLVAIAERAKPGTCLFVDVAAGPWEAPPVEGVEQVNYLALPAHWQHGALAAQLEIFAQQQLSGCLITFTDLATNLSPVVSAVVESQLGVAFLSSGRDVTTGIEVMDPVALASGICAVQPGETTNGRLVATA